MAVCSTALARNLHAVTDTERLRIVEVLPGPLSVTGSGEKLGLYCGTGFICLLEGMCHALFATETRVI